MGIPNDFVLRLDGQHTASALTNGGTTAPPATRVRDPRGGPFQRFLDVRREPGMAGQAGKQCGGGAGA
ncbi:MAG: hypothetical protein ACRDNO_26110 [Trebonia sp.]